MQSYFDYSPEVQQAMIEHRPIVALESTLITHGIPFPKNLELAQAAEEILRKQGVTPATIAIMEGKIKIGLTTDELHTLVQDKRVLKASKRDIPYALCVKANAGLTVAATIFCADSAGIKVFATGGIGGVHRGNELDISADLLELAKTPIAVVCSGAKAILDIAKTLEFLETYSVPVVGYHTTTFPAFYSAESAHSLLHSIKNIDALTTLLRAHWQLGLSGAVLIANPIPKEHAIPATVIEPIIERALSAATAKKISGNALTPFLLAEIATYTEGKSLTANIELICSNVTLAGKIAQSIYATTESLSIKSKSR